MISIVYGRGITRTYETSPRGEITRTYETSPRGEITKMTMPQNGNTPALATQNLIEKWTYTPNGEVSRFQSPMRDIYYEYDRRGLMTKVDYPDPNVDTTFTYDQLGRRTSMVDSTGTTSWDFDVWGDLIEMVSPQGTVRYEFNTAREMTKLINVQTGGNLVTEYVRNTAGQVEEIKSAYNEVTTLWYDTFGRLEQKDLPHGLSEFIGYDSQDRLSSIEIRNSATNAVVSSQSYAYDSASNVATHIQDGIRTDYTYDANHQLLSETKRNGVLTTSPITYTGVYTYDANGNRLSRTVNGVQEVYTVDQGDKLLEIRIGGALHRQYGYDLDGRRTSKVAGGQTTVYSWNVDSRLTGIDLPGTSADPSYVYNGIGTRVSRTVNAHVKNWKRSGAGVTAAVLNENAVRFTPGISSRDGSVSTFTHAGLKNTERQSVTTSISATRQHDAFGNVISSSGTWQTAFGYAGNFGYQQTDDNLHLLGHRYYDSETGRFISRDPIKDGRNWYGYCMNNPGNMADPDGLRPRPPTKDEYQQLDAAITELFEFGKLEEAIKLEEMLDDGKILVDPSMEGSRGTYDGNVIVISISEFADSGKTGIASEFGTVTLAGILLHEYVHSTQRRNHFNVNSCEIEAYQNQLDWLRKRRAEATGMLGRLIDGEISLVESVAKEYGWRPIGRI